MNVIILTGNATKDIELRYTNNGHPVARGTIAVKRDYKSQNGEYETDFHNYKVLGKLAEVMANHIRKGDKFGIKGKLQNSVWQQESGEKKYFTEVLVDGFDFPQKSKSEGNNTINQSKPPQRANTEPTGTHDDDPFKDDGLPIDISDDDLPFN